MTVDRAALVYHHAWTGGLRGAGTTLHVTAEGLVEEAVGRCRRIPARDVVRVEVVGSGLKSAVYLRTRSGAVALRLPRLAASEADRLAACLRTRWRLAAL